jgi:predicted  nucleic acid-binding Zn-ribbon protein
MNQKFDQHIQSINAQTEEIRRQNAELRMKTETFERYMFGDEEDKQKINSRLNKLESKVLLA